ncbi:hypothetical protein LX36DRAFT_660662 [Colletotrichum falcatum]|nr:hypothetical protein LX36DRAFT_660662 [Colletotrichum falcatum]
MAETAGNPCRSPDSCHVLVLTRPLTRPYRRQPTPHRIASPNPEFGAHEFVRILTQGFPGENPPCTSSGHRRSALAGPEGFSAWSVGEARLRAPPQRRERRDGAPPFSGPPPTMWARKHPGHIPRRPHPLLLPKSPVQKDIYIGEADSTLGRRGGGRAGPSSLEGEGHGESWPGATFFGGSQGRSPHSLLARARIVRGGPARRRFPLTNTHTRTHAHTCTHTCQGQEDIQKRLMVMF